MSADLNPPAMIGDLAELSAKAGADPLLIQGAGGNTSVKDGPVMWIKASGTLLADALRRDIFVPVDLTAMRTALSDGRDEADQPALFALGDSGLRPSIETSLHAVFEHPVVVHVHCVNTLALAIRADAEKVLAEKLAGFDWAFVPYAKPGAQLARSVQARRGPETDVVVLGNHGLLLAAQTVAEASDLLDRVVAALRAEPAVPAEPDVAALEALADGTDYGVPEKDAVLHQLALSSARVEAAVGGSLYPDHVIFCGVGASALAPGASLPSGDGPVFLIVPGKGVVLRRDASAGAQALSRCLADVLIRWEPGTALTYLTEAENHELMDWDAEKYRKTLDVG